MFPSDKKSILDRFRKQPDPKELVRKWQAMLRTEVRGVDRQIREVQREEKVAQKQVKEAAQRGDLASARMLARELVRTRKAVSQLYINKAHMVSMSTQLSEQVAMVRVAGSLQKSGEVMKAVNDLMKIPQLNQTMMAMSREMMKAGLIDEMMGDMVDSALDTEDLEEQTEEEVDKVLLEVAGETLSKMASAPRGKMAQAAAQPAQEVSEDDLAERLNAVRT